MGRIRFASSSRRGNKVEKRVPVDTGKGNPVLRRMIEKGVLKRNEGGGYTVDPKEYRRTEDELVNEYQRDLKKASDAQLREWFGGSGHLSIPAARAFFNEFSRRRIGMKDEE